MDLHEYPRPANDTGIGIHWSPGYAASIGLAKIREYWIPEMKAMGIKWVKISNHDGAKEFAELLLAEGFMPIVRIYRGRSNPGRLTLRELVEVDSLTRVGVHYIEFNNEPDQDSEWKGGRVPVNAIDIVVEDVIADLEALLARGAMPAVPAVSSGSSWDLIGKIVEKGRKDLFDGPVWQALHNFPRNRPLDYPYDIGNQEGTPYTDRFYATIAGEPSGFDAWHGRGLQEINRLRAEHANPRATITEDHACWLAYQYFNERHRHHLGRSLPILSTENGYLLSENTDPRYPATTPNLHMAQTLEACRVMMGSSERFKSAPDYYFCTAFAIIANQQLGSQAEWWENQAWYSDRWPSGKLPIVQALQAEPKTLRTWQGNELGTSSKISGTVFNTAKLPALKAAEGDGPEENPAEENPAEESAAEGNSAEGNSATENSAAEKADDPYIVVLESGGEEVARVELDGNNRYSFPNIQSGAYTVRVAGTDLLESITIAKEQSEAVLDLDMDKLAQVSQQSEIHGMVKGGCEVVVMLLRTEDGEEWITMTAEDGTFRIVDLPAGTYNIRVHPHGSHIQDFALDGESSLEVSLAKEGWGHVIHYVDDPLFGADTWAEEASDLTLLTRKLRCAVPGHKSLSVQASTAEWRSTVETTGSASQYGEFACEIDLGTHPDSTETEEYSIRVDGIEGRDGMPVEVRTNLELALGRIPFITFSYYDTTSSQRASNSVISGVVRGDFLTQDGDKQTAGQADNGASPEQKLPVVVLRDGQAREQRQRVSATGEYLFKALRAGTYSIFVEDAVRSDGRPDPQAARDELTLDGINRLTVDLVLSSVAVSDDVPKMTMSRSVIAAVVPGAVSKTAHLVDRVGNEYVRIVANDERVRFSGLGAGTYSLTVDGGFEQGDLIVDGSDGREIFFTPLSTKWVAEVSETGSMPGFSAVRVEVENRKGVLVYLSKEDWPGMSAESGSRPDLGEFALEFSPLDPGYYIVEPDGLGVSADVDLTGLEAMRVGFREQTGPSNPNVVLPLRIEANQSFESSSSFVDQYSPSARLESGVESDLSAAEPESELESDDLDRGDFERDEFEHEDLERDDFDRDDFDRDDLENENPESGGSKSGDLATEDTLNIGDLDEVFGDSLLGGLSDDSADSPPSSLGRPPESVPSTESIDESGRVDSDVGFGKELATTGSAIAPAVLPTELADEKFADEEFADDEFADEDLSDDDDFYDEPIQYLYIGAQVDWWTSDFADRLTAILRYVAIAQPEVGSDHDAAAQADEVIILGEVDALFVQYLEQRGIQVAQVSDRLIRAFKQLYENQ